MKELVGSTVFAGASFLVFSYFHVAGSEDHETRAGAWEFMAVTLRMFCALQMFDLTKNITKVALIYIMPDIYESLMAQAGAFVVVSLALTALAQYSSLQSVGYNGFNGCLFDPGGCGRQAKFRRARSRLYRSRFRN